MIIVARCFGRLLLTAISRLHRRIRSPPIHNSLDWHRLWQHNAEHGKATYATKLRAVQRKKDPLPPERDRRGWPLRNVRTTRCAVDGVHLPPGRLSTLPGAACERECNQCRAA